MHHEKIIEPGATEELVYLHYDPQLANWQSCIVKYLEKNPDYDPSLQVMVCIPTDSKFVTRPYKTNTKNVIKNDRIFNHTEALTLGTMGG